MEKQSASETAAKINGKTISIKAKAGSNSRLFGSVTAGHIADALNAQFNTQIEKKKISLKNDIKNFGTYSASVKLYSGITADITVEVSEE